MKTKSLLLSLLWSLSWPVLSAQTIVINSPYSAGHGGHASMMRVLDEANRLQKKYNFIQENRPGAQGAVALKHIHDRGQDHLAIIHAAFVDNIENKIINETDYVPVHAVGDACWAIGILSQDKNLSKIADIKGVKELVVGTVGMGNVSHLTGIAIAKQQKIPQRVILFKSNYDAVINLVGDHGVNFVVERPLILRDFQARAPGLSLVGMSCPERHPLIPTVPTLAEQGFVLPSVFNIVMAHSSMTIERRREIAQILDQATLSVGKDEIRRLSDFVSPVFAKKLTAQQFYDSRISAIRQLRAKYRSELNEDK